MCNSSFTNRYPNLNDPKNKNLESALEMALKEAVDDETFRKVKRMSYSNNAADEVRHTKILFTFFTIALSNKIHV